MIQHWIRFVNHTFRSGLLAEGIRERNGQLIFSRQCRNVKNNGTSEEGLFAANWLYVLIRISCGANLQAENHYQLASEQQSPETVQTRHTVERRACGRVWGRFPVILGFVYSAVRPTLQGIAGEQDLGPVRPVRFLVFRSHHPTHAAGQGSSVRFGRFGHATRCARSTFQHDTLPVIGRTFGIRSVEEIGQERHRKSA